MNDSEIFGMEISENEEFLFIGGNFQIVLQQFLC
jgi:hypothetical protein